MGAGRVLADNPERAREFGTEFRMHEAALRAVALRLCRNPAEANDLVQDTAERALKAFGGLPPGSNTRSWLMSILRNKFIDSCRHTAVAPRAAQEVEEVADIVSAQEREPEPAWAQITAEQIKAAVAALGDEFRSVYTLHALEGRSYNEIAGALQIPRATVGTRLLRARKKLKELLLPHLAAQEVEP
jgi:RNA polymerase sigma-70 factor (ECF subfamily)